MPKLTLAHAATLGSVTEVEAAIARGESLEQASSQGFRPLDLAIRRTDANTLKIINTLLRHGADPFVTNKNGQSLLHQAVLNSRDNDPTVRAKIELLLKLGLDINARDDMGSTPLMAAAMFAGLSTVEPSVGASGR